MAARLPARLPVWLALVGLALAAACAGPLPEPADLTRLPQDAAATLARTPGADWRLGPGAQDRLARDYRRRRLSCWLSPDASFTAGQVRLLAAPVAESPGFGAHGRRHGPDWLAGLWRRAALERYPNAGWPGLTTRRADLRVLPTSRPDYAARPGRPGGYPFDRLQQTALAADTPVWVHHHSREGGWLWVETPAAWGWLPADSAARLTPEQVRELAAAPWAAATGEEIPLVARPGGFLHSASLGQLMPLAGREPGAFTVLAAARGARGWAELLPARLPAGRAALWPLRLTPANLARLADRLMGQPYGWGGLYGWRDCSATMRDLFAAFGLWLPRNSGDQARSGPRLELAGLAPAAKLAAIRRQGVPWLSLLWMPGHVMLYLGAPDGEPLVLHSAWGVRTWSLWSGEGRALISRTAITTLRPGRELPQAAGSLLERVEALVFLVPPQDLEREK
jgi:hypothetical protein